ncbi:MAG TPA: hypothetical protein VN622_07465 [Clostridia bacterium]|nr:hypothetical protein [Clostridia bacterium]
MRQDAISVAPQSTSLWVNIGERLFTFPAVLVGLLALLVFFFARRDIADPDLWWHLRNVQHLLATHKFPSFDSYSYTAAGASWLAHEWLSEIPFYVAFRVAGLTGVFVLVAILSEAIMLGVFYLAYRISGDVKNAFLTSVLGVMLATVSIGARTLLFGWLYLVVMLILLERFRAGEKARLWLIPPLFCLWVNTHGSWVMGMTIFGTIIACGFLEGSWGKVYAIRWSPSQLRRLLITASASVAALFINPFGYKLVFYPFDLIFRQKLNLASIQEWQSVDFHTARGKLIIGLLLGMMLVSLVSRVRWRLDEVALVCLALYTGLTHIRLLFLGAIVLPGILAKHFKLMPPYDKESDKPWMNAVVLGIVLFIMVGKVTSIAPWHNEVRESYPEAAVNHLKTHDARGRIFHDYVWGGYLIWHAPQFPVFVDGRADIFERGGVLKDYLAAMSLDDTLALFDRYKVDYVLVSPKSQVSYLLQHTPGWAIEYRDEVAIVFRRELARREIQDNATIGSLVVPATANIRRLATP